MLILKNYTCTFSHNIQSSVFQSNSILFNLVVYTHAFVPPACFAWYLRVIIFCLTNISWPNKSFYTRVWLLCEHRTSERKCALLIWRLVGRLTRWPPPLVRVVLVSNTQLICCTSEKETPKAKDDRWWIRRKSPRLARRKSPRLTRKAR